MAITHEISAELRNNEGKKGASRRLRRSGKVPAIVYGGTANPVSIQMEHNTIYLASQNEWFYSAILDLKLNDKNQKVLLRDLQRHPFKPQIMHLDFQRVDENKTIRIRVPLHFLNQETSPAGKTSGVLISHALNELEVSCLPKNLPEFIEVDLANLQIGDIVHISDLKLPQGVEIPELRLGKEHDLAVVTAQAVRAEAASVAAEATTSATPPVAKKETKK